MEIVNCKFETHGKFNIDVKINLQNYNKSLKYFACTVMISFTSLTQARERAGRKGRFMLHNFGKVHYVHNEKKSENFDFQVNFIAQRVRRSLITIQLEADSIKTVINK